MDGDIESGIDRVIPKLVELFELLGYDVEAEQLVDAFESVGLEIVSAEDYEDFRHG